MLDPSQPLGWSRAVDYSQNAWSLNVYSSMIDGARFRLLWPLKPILRWCTFVCATACGNWAYNTIYYCIVLYPCRWILMRWYNRPNVFSNMLKLSCSLWFFVDRLAPHDYGMLVEKRGVFMIDILPCIWILFFFFNILKGLANFLMLGNTTVKFI